MVGKAVLGGRHGKDLDWASNGVYAFKGIDRSDVKIPLADITGKAIVVCKYILTIPTSLLMETG